MTRTGINWLLIHDHLKVNIMLPCVHHEGTWGSGVTTTLILNCSQPHVMAALSPNPMEMHGPTFASCDVKIKPQAMDNLFKGLAVITYCMKACYSRVHITSLFALFSLVSVYIYIYIYIYRFQNIFLRCPTPGLHCFLSSHWPSFRFLLFMTFLIPSIQFFFGLPRALFCFGTHCNAIFGNLPSAIL